tara:strand:+ start:143 stop:736 length:594 start_codon:yes stop_codon:yes gene_type:complete
MLTIYGDDQLNLFADSAPSVPSSPKEFAVMPIEKAVAASLYAAHHYLGDKDFLCQYSFGAAYQGRILACITFAIPNARVINGIYAEHEQKGVLEISRLVAHPDCPRNTCSWLISQSIKTLRKKYPLRIIITYADTAQGHTGAIYKASNFTYAGLTAPKTDFVHSDGKIKKMKGVKYSELEGEWVPRSRKHLFVKRYE